MNMRSYLIPVVVFSCAMGLVYGMGPADACQGDFPRAVVGHKHGRDDHDVSEATSAAHGEKRLREGDAVSATVAAAPMAAPSVESTRKVILISKPSRKGLPGKRIELFPEVAKAFSTVLCSQLECVQDRCIEMPVPFSERVLQFVVNILTEVYFSIQEGMPFDRAFTDCDCLSDCAFMQDLLGFKAWELRHGGPSDIDKELSLCCNFLGIDFLSISRLEQDKTTPYACFLSGYLPLSLAGMDDKNINASRLFEESITSSGLWNIAGRIVNNPDQRFLLDMCARIFKWYCPAPGHYEYYKPGLQRLRVFIGESILEKIARCGDTLSEISPELAVVAYFMDLPKEAKHRILASYGWSPESIKQVFVDGVFLARGRDQEFLTDALAKDDYSDRQKQFLAVCSQFADFLYRPNN